ncbi:MAG TPA: ester cyclase [Gaiellales bacterium]|jgi:predicted ester cyclase
MADQTILDVYRRFIEEGASVSNAEVMERTLAPGIELPTVGEGGVAALIAVHGAIRAGFPDLRATIDEITESGGWVGARLTWTGTHTGEFAGVAATGRRVTVTELEIVHIVDGQVVELRNVLDVATLIGQLTA